MGPRNLNNHDQLGAPDFLTFWLNHESPVLFSWLIASTESTERKGVRYRRDGNCSEKCITARQKIRA
jgi:hypothetical protein